MNEITSSDYDEYFDKPVAIELHRQVQLFGPGMDATGNVARLSAENGKEYGSPAPLAENGEKGQELLRTAILMGVMKRGGQHTVVVRMQIANGVVSKIVIPVALICAISIIDELPSRLAL